MESEMSVKKKAKITGSTDSDRRDEKQDRETKDESPSREKNCTVSDHGLPEIANQYKAALADVTFNSKPIITNLTIIAGDYSHAAKSIATVICDHILEVPSEHKLPSLYVLDSIVKNIGGDYIKYFSARLPEVFCKAYKQVDTSTHPGMQHLFGTWKGVFPESPLRNIEDELQLPLSTSPSGRSTQRTSDSQPQRPGQSIHVNPKYLAARQLQQSSRAEETKFESDNEQHIVETEKFKESVHGSPKRWSELSGKAEEPRASVNEPGYIQNASASYRNCAFPKVKDSIMERDSGLKRPWNQEHFCHRDYAKSSMKHGQWNGYDWQNASSPGALIDAYGNYRGARLSTIGSGLHMPLPNQESSISNRRIMSKNWKTSEEEEYIWEENSKIADDRRGITNGKQRNWFSGDNDGVFRTENRTGMPPWQKQSDGCWCLPGPFSHDDERVNVEAQCSHKELEDNILPLQHSNHYVLGSQSTQGWFPSPNVSTTSDFSVQSDGVDEVERRNCRSNFDVLSSVTPPVPCAQQSGSPLLHNHQPIQPISMHSCKSPQNAESLTTIPQVPNPANTHDTNLTSGSLIQRFPLKSSQNVPSSIKLAQHGSQMHKLTERTHRSPLPHLQKDSLQALSYGLHQIGYASNQVVKTTSLSMPGKVNSSIQPVLSNGTVTSMTVEVLASTTCMIPNGFSSFSNGPAQHLHMQLPLPPSMAPFISEISKRSGKTPGTLSYPPSSSLPQPSTVSQPPLPPGPPPLSSLLATISQSTSIASGSIVATPISDLLSSLVAKGLISAPGDPFSPSVVSLTSKPSQAYSINLDDCNNGSFNATGSFPVTQSLHALPSSGLYSDNSKEADVFKNSVGVTFQQNVLRERHEFVIRRLYDDMPRHCRICGLRFTLEEEHSRHMDWHAEKYEKQSSRKMSSRGWYTSSNYLLCRTAASKSDSRLPFLNEQICSQTQEGDDTVVPANESQSICTLCGEPFEDFYSDVLEEWMYKGAVYLNSPPEGHVGSMDPSQLGPIVHAKCRSNSGQNNLS